MLEITPAKGIVLGLDILIPSNDGSIHLEFRNSLLKHARIKRKQKFITRITVD